jgi:hypothetical protein
LKRILNLVILATLFLLTPLCDLCAQLPKVVCTELSCCNGGHDPTPAAVMISHTHSKNEWMFSYKYMRMQMNDLLSETQTISKNDVFVNYLMSPDKMFMDMHMIMGMYGLNNRLTLMAMFNYNKTIMNMSMFTAAHHHAGSDTTMAMTHSMQTNGLSDFKCSMLYRLMDLPNYQLLFSAGVSFPLGSIAVKGASKDAMYPNRPYPYSMQLGSGTFDLLPCVNYLYQKSKFTSSIQISGIVRTHYNSMNYKLGNELTLHTWLSYQWLSFLSHSVRLEGHFADKISGYDSTLYAYNEPAANTANYGGKRLNIAFGTVAQFKKGFMKQNRFAFEYVMPIYQHLNGIQMKFNNTLSASWSIGF